MRFWRPRPAAVAALYSSAARRAFASKDFRYVPLPTPNKTLPVGISVFREIEQIAEDSDVFRRVLWTGRNSQLVVMKIPVGEEIGEEVHQTDQHLTFVRGNALATVNGVQTRVYAGDLVSVPAGARHNFENMGQTPLVLYTVYAPAQHAPDTVAASGQEAKELEKEGKDKPPDWARELHRKDPAIEET